jgi:hypothetical protein
MGDELAGAADEIYKAFVEASPAFGRMQVEGFADAQTFAELMAAHVGGLRQALLFLAGEMEDPNPLDRALLDSLHAFVDAPASDTATEPAG